jgi:SecD/SecF fusion protein
MTAMLNWNLIRILIIVAFVAALFPVRRYFRNFFWRITICLVPLVIAAVIAGNATARYLTEGGGFKLGVDLVGGTILVYEVDATKMTESQKENFKPAELASRLKKRLDPNDLFNISIRLINTGKVENTRVEIILPTGGKHQQDIENRDWQELLSKARERWGKLDKATLEKIPRGNQQQLKDRIHDQGGAPYEEAETFVRENYKTGTEKHDVTAEQIQTIKNQISQVGALEFRILANDRDDKEAVERARAYFDNPDVKKTLDYLAVQGDPPPAPTPADGSRYFHVPDLDNLGDRGLHTYSWVEIGVEERWSLGLNNDADDPWKNMLAHVHQRWGSVRRDELDAIPPKVTVNGKEEDNDAAVVDLIVARTGIGQQEAREFVAQNKFSNPRWREVGDARKANKPVLLTGRQEQGNSNYLVYSRDCVNRHLSSDEQKAKRYEYFLLTRDPEVIPEPGKEPVVKKITGDQLTSKPETDERMNWVVGFQFDTAGGRLFYDVTSKNVPTGPEGGKFYRHLAIILDNQIISAPTINAAISNRGIIQGNYTQETVTQFVTLLNSGALPAALKPNPVSENTMGATLGADTIKWGTLSVGVAFLAILVFMVVYYRFAGMVACVALFANLLLTVAFMVLVSATFTLPGLAGLVLMLGMAVDANVLIYERLREERDRGASLALAIRNGYDRAFPTIIDTHLSSIFTAIVLYAVGNDQLKGFGISLAVGLFISLFTSLYMTRLMFDLWLARGWLKKLSMFRLLSRTNIDFMAIRYYWFAATILLTIFGISVFIWRMPSDLNIDFNGGTLYGGQLSTPKSIEDLRQLLSEKGQAEKLKVAEVKELNIAGEQRLAYAIRYEGEPAPRTIHFPNQPEGATPEDREREVKRRASELPDWSVELIFRGNVITSGNQTDYFNVRTTEKAQELVQASIVRLLGPALKKTDFSILNVGALKPDSKSAELQFHHPNSSEVAYASPGLVETLLRRECQKRNLPYDFTWAVAGSQNPDPAAAGQYSGLLVTWKGDTPPEGGIRPLLEAVQREFGDRPIPDRLENFDTQLAQDTQRQAMYAILASWAAILLYLWFRFGSWTFGLATVLCLIHDLFFTLGIIAFSHYIHTWWPNNWLLIEDFKIDLPAVAALLTLVGYSVNDTIVVFDRIREVRGKNPELTPQMINDSVNQTLSRTLLTAFSVFLVVIVLYIFGGEGIHLFSFVMVVGVVVGTYSSIYIASPLLLIFGEGAKKRGVREQRERPAVGATV